MTTPGEIPSVSIVTPVFNCAATIERCLDSVWSQHEYLLEHFVVDAGSTDGTVEVLERYAALHPDFLFFSSEPDRGIADGFNKGIRASKGDWIGILNADDWYEDNALAKLIPYMDRDAILHGRSRLHEPKTGAARESGTLDYDPARHFRPMEKMPAQWPTCFIPRSIYEGVGLYSTEFRLAMDYEFFLRAHLAGVEFRYLPEVIANFTLGGASGQDRNSARREMALAQMLHRREIWGPLRLYLKDIVKASIRRRRRKLLRRPIH